VFAPQGLGEVEPAGQALPAGQGDCPTDPPGQKLPAEQAAQPPTPSSWEPGLQVNPHFVPSQLGDALEGGLHVVQLLPQQLVAPLASQPPCPLSW
jgi:hypothetical protein